MLPTGPAQQALIRAALGEHSVEHDVESHGTGTPLGDAIETESLNRIMLRNATPSAPTRIGALKSILGHTEASSGLVGLLKSVLLSIHHHVTPNLHLQSRNPNFGCEQTSLLLSSQVAVHFDNVVSGVRGVSSFGFSGCNAHAVLSSSVSRLSAEIVYQKIVQYKDTAFTWREATSSQHQTNEPAVKVNLALLNNPMVSTSLTPYEQQQREKKRLADRAKKHKWCLK